MVDGQLVSDVPAGEVITTFVQSALGADEGGPSSRETACG